MVMPMRCRRWIEWRRSSERWAWSALLVGAAVLSVSAGTLNVTFSSISTGAVVNLTTNGVLDWVHWGLETESSLDRKGGVVPQISDFTPVHPTNGYTFIYQYADNWNGYSWADGTPHLSITNTPTGVWAYSSGPGGVVLTGSGFRFNAAADTNVKVLRVYVGAFGARGKFTASLSDASAPAFSSQINNSVYNTGNGPSAVYTLVFAANASNQWLTVTYTLENLAPMRIYDGNVTLQAAALTASNANNVPFVALTSPADGATASSSTNLVLSAIASDADGSVLRVEFMAGTNQLGTATTAPYSFVWSNPPPGKYTLIARAIDDVGGVGISKPVEVFVHGTGGSITGSRGPAPTALNLTVEGTSDWAHWGLLNESNFNHRASGGAQISGFTRLGTNRVQRFTDNRTAFTWTDGTPVASVANTNAGVFIGGLTNGFQISAPADTNLRTLRVYAGLYGAQGNFQVWLTDFSGRAYTDTTLSNVFGNSYVVYTLTYSAASPNQRLIVRYTVQNLFDFDYGNVTLAAATLQGPAPAAPVVLFNAARDANHFRFSFASAANTSHAVQFTPSLAPLDWQTFTNLTGTGGTLSVTDWVGAAGQRFYRVLSP